MKDYLITYWWGIPEAYFSEERVIEAIEDGFNLLHFSYEPENNKKALALCQKHGVHAMIADGRMYKAMNEPENREKILTALTDDYKNEPALFGYYVTDEPNADQFPMLADIVATLKRLDPAHPAYINLFPNYANAAQLGNPTYDAHLRAYMETVKPEILSYDHYHLLTTEQPKEFITFDNEREAGIYAAAQKRTARAGFYDNIEAIRRYGLEFAVPYMLIILLTEHGPYRYLSEPEIAYEAYQTLAYGCSMLSYFTYWTPDGGDHWHFRNGIISEDGKKCSHYYDVQKINREIAPIGRRIANTTSTAVFHVGEEKEQVVPFAPCQGIDGITGGNLTVGCFADGTMLIANKDFAADAEVAIQTSHRLERLDPASDTFVPCEKTITIPAGRGVYLRIL